VFQEDRYDKRKYYGPFKQHRAAKEYMAHLPFHEDGGCKYVVHMTVVYDEIAPDDNGDDDFEAVGNRRIIRRFSDYKGLGEQQRLENERLRRGRKPPNVFF